MKKIVVLSLCLLMVWPFAGCKKDPDAAPVPKDGVYVVGEHIRAETVTDFYYTISASTFPPHYQRYRFFIEDGAYRFFHETREGDHWPLFASDATATGTITLTKEQWNAFLACIAEGTVIARQEHLDSGGDGPWLYLYWTGDPGDVQEFSFASLNARFSFEALCESLRES